MTSPHPVAPILTPRERFTASLAEHFPRLRPDAVEVIADLAGEYAAALIEECARSPRSQQDPLWRGGSDVG